jgi:hypothetical protein
MELQSVLLAVDSDRKVLAALDHDLTRRFARDYRIGSDIVHWPLDRPPLPQEASTPGVFTAGDVRPGSVKRELRLSVRAPLPSSWCIAT